MDVKLDLADLKLAVALYNLTGALDPRNGALIDDVRFELFDPSAKQGDLLTPPEVYLRVAIRVSQSEDPIIAFVPRSVVALAAGRLALDVLFRGQIGDTIASTQVVGNSVDELAIRAQPAADIVDRIAATTPAAPVA